ncbi:hypothetical protein Tco_1362967 [Tanacetum coccineum]
MSVAQVVSSQPLIKLSYSLANRVIGDCQAVMPAGLRWDKVLEWSGESIVETDKVNHAVETDIVKLVVEIESFGMSADELDKETRSSDGLQPKVKTLTEEAKKRIFFIYYQREDLRLDDLAVSRSMLKVAGVEVGSVAGILRFRIILKSLVMKDVEEEHSKLNTNSEPLCVKCNGCMLSDNHDLYVLDFINDVNARTKSKSVKKSSKRKVWKPTGKVFTNIIYTWRPTCRTFTIVGNACPLTRITTTTKVPFRKPTAPESDTLLGFRRLYNLLLLVQH